MRRWVLMHVRHDDGGEDIVWDGDDLAVGEQVRVVESSELDAALAENARLVAGLESIERLGKVEDPKTGVIYYAPGAGQARMVLEGSTRPLERYTERIEALKVEVESWREACAYHMDIINEFRARIVTLEAEAEAAQSNRTFHAQHNRHSTNRDQFGEG